jgi:hypothetical protein
MQETGCMWYNPCSDIRNRSEIHMVHIKTDNKPTRILDNVHTWEKKQTLSKDSCLEIYLNIIISLYFTSNTFMLTQTSNFCRQKFKWIENKIIWLIHNTVSVPKLHSIKSNMADCVWLTDQMGCSRNQLWSILRQTPSICWEEIWNPWKYSQDSQTPVNVPPESG